MISPISDSKLEYLVMLLENEERQADADREQLKVARAERRVAFEQEAEELHKAADAAQAGAFASMGFSLVGGAAQIGAGITELKAAGESFELADLPEASPEALRQKAVIKRLDATAHLEQASGEMVSQAGNSFVASVNDQKHHEADAVLARARASDASDRVEDARSHREKVDRRRETVLSSMEELQRQAQAARDALLRNG